jgi:hypothetical protein
MTIEANAPSALTNRRRASEVGTALLIGVVAFGFRGLARRQLTNDHYMHLAWAQQILRGDLPGRDFRDPGMPLSYSASAAVQYFWPGPFSEAMLTSAFLGLSAAITYLVIVHLSGSRLWAVAGAVLEIAFQPRLYSYPKILVPAVTLLAVCWYVDKPSRRLVALAVWTVVATLFRYDLGVYTWTSIAVGLAIFHFNGWLTPARTLLRYAIACALAIVPYLAYVHWAQGLGEHFEEGMQFGRSDANQILHELPRFAPVLVDLGHWSQADAAVLISYVSYILAVVTPVLVVARAREPRRGDAAVIGAGAVLLLWYVAFILRHPIQARVPDLAAVVAIFGALACFESMSLTRRLVARRRLASVSCGGALTLATAGVVVVVAMSVGLLSKVYEQVRETHVLDGWAKFKENIGNFRAEGTEWPWSSYWPGGQLPEVIRYLDECTKPSDRLFLTWPAPEYYFFARRPFGAGIAYPTSLTDDLQGRMAQRLEAQQVPLVLINEQQRHEPSRLDDYLRQEYVPVGGFKIRDGSAVTIAVRKDVRATRSFGTGAWPCAFEPAGPPNSSPNSF